MIRLNGTDFAETTEQEQASYFEFIYFRGPKATRRHVVEDIAYWGSKKYKMVNILLAGHLTSMYKVKSW